MAAEPKKVRPLRLAPVPVLLADDSETARFAIGSPLSKVGFKVAEACDGEEALALAAQHQFKAIVTDVRMPSVNGLALVRRLRELPGYEEVPIIMMSGTDSEAMRQRGLASGACDWLVKPFAPAALQKLLEERIA